MNVCDHDVISTDFCPPLSLVLIIVIEKIKNWPVAAF